MLTEIRLTLGSQEIHEVVFVQINEPIELLFCSENLVRELARSIALLTKARGVEILARKVGLVMREGASRALVTASCKEKLAEFLRLERGPHHLGAVWSHTLVALTHGVELVSTSAASSPAEAPTLALVRSERATTEAAASELLVASGLEATTSELATLVKSTAATSEVATKAATATELLLIAASTRSLLVVVIVWLFAFRPVVVIVAIAIVILARELIRDLKLCQPRRIT